jgi:lysophospholipase L1-like esterase
MLLAQVGMVLDGLRFDVIHLNNGMHGWQHSDAEYRNALPRLLALIRKHAPQAKLIWASTTPIRQDGTGPDQASDARIQARNLDALNCVKAAPSNHRVDRPRAVWIDDLYSLMKGHPEMHSDNVHFGEEGVKLQAHQVAQVIRDVLNAP